MISFVIRAGAVAAVLMGSAAVAALIVRSTAVAVLVLLVAGLVAGRCYRTGWIRGNSRSSK